MKKYLLHFITLLLAISLIPLSADADIPGPNEWSNPGGYFDNFTTCPNCQRNILVYFSISSPYMIINYNGDNDDILQESDWYDIDYDGGGNIIPCTFDGTDYLFAYGPLEGSVLFHLDNWDRSEPYFKRIYMETELITNINPNTVDLNDYVDYDIDYGGSAEEYDLRTEVIDWQVIGDPIIIEGETIYQVLGYVYAEIFPNPEFEELELYFTLDESEFIGVEYLHIATECVPVPSAVWLLGSGLIGIVGIRRKFKK